MKARKKGRVLIESSIVQEDIRTISEDIKSLSFNLEGKTILIAGGAGFLGKYIILTLDYLNKHILKDPCRIIVIDNFISSVRECIQKDDNIVIIEQDISKSFQLKYNIDFIMHTASLASPLFYNKFRLRIVF